MPDFYMGAGDLNSGPHARTAIALPDKPFPWPCYQPFLCFLEIFIQALFQLLNQFIPVSAIEFCDWFLDTNFFSDI